MSNKPPVSITIKTVGFDEVEKALGEFKNKAPSVLYNIIKRVATNVNKNISKYTRKRYVIKTQDIKKTLKIKKPSKTDLSAVIQSNGAPLSLTKFKITSSGGLNPISMKGIPKEGDKNYPGRARYKVRVLRASNLTKKEHSFMQRMRNGHLALFIRKKYVKAVFGKQAQKIKELHGPSVPQMISNDEVMNSINRDAQETYEKRIEHEIKRILNRYGT